jgi:hypothetical protein
LSKHPNYKPQCHPPLLCLNSGPST